MSQQLVAEKIIKTLAVLNTRINERFPEAGLVQVCSDLLATAEQTARRAKQAGRPNFLLRFLVFVVLAITIPLMVFAVYSLHPEDLFNDASTAEVTQALESIVNLFILAGALIWYFISREAQQKRRFVLKHLYELRSIAHIIDMHQLTKDPISLSKRAVPTRSSPTREYTSFELARYLDYCSEMLSITGKLAALYGEQTNDTEVIGAVNDIEILTAGIGRKIWQKIMIISDDTIAEEHGA